MLFMELFRIAMGRCTEAVRGTFHLGKAAERFARIAPERCGVLGFLKSP